MRLLIEKAIAHLETPSRQKAIQALDHSAPLAELLQLANADRPKNAEAWREVLSLALGAEIEQENARTLYQGAWWSAMLRGGQLHSGEPLQDVYTGLINNRAIIDQIAIVHGDPEMPVVVLHEIGRAHV